MPDDTTHANVAKKARKLDGSPCVVCEQSVDGAVEDGSAVLTFYRGEWRLVHTPCFDDRVTHGV